jgi:hypothetical protein
VTPKRLFSWRSWAVGAVGPLALISIGFVQAADVDLTKLSAQEIKALEGRLTDAGC